MPSSTRAPERTYRPLACAALLALALGAAVGSGCAPTGTAAPADFGRGAGGKADGVGDPDLPCDIAALVSNHCTRCHAGPGARKGVKLDSYASITGPAPTAPTVTVAARALARMKDSLNPMPPQSQFPLEPAQIAAFEAWVNAGTPATGCAAVDGGPDAGDATDAALAFDPFAVAPTCTSNDLWTGGNEGSPFMNPGRACLSCHKFAPGGAPDFAFAGTVYPTAYEPNDCFGSDAEGAKVIITDANGTEHTAVVNQAGNFGMLSGALPFAVPYTARVEFEGRVRHMSDPQTSGDCNGCHTSLGKNGAPGRIVLP